MSRSAPNPSRDQPSLAHTSGRFSVEIAGNYANTIHLSVRVDRKPDPVALWTHRFADIGDRDAVLEAFATGSLDLLFLGRVTMHFGQATLAEAVGRVIQAAREVRRARAVAEAQHRLDHAVVELFARNAEHGYRLDLQRRSDATAAWSVRYDRAIERDRLCDWLRWQRDRFESFLGHAAEHGDEALTKLLTDAMFETERRIKKEGRGAGGQRPLRMWRGD